MTTNYHIEYGGFVKNLNTGEYQCLFVTRFSKLLARERAKERAAFDNSMFPDTFDIKDIIVRSRMCEEKRSGWE